MKWTWDKLAKESPREAQEELSNIIPICAWQWILEESDSYGLKLSDEDKKKLMRCLFHMGDQYVGDYLKLNYEDIHIFEVIE